MAPKRCEIKGCKETKFTRQLFKFPTKDKLRSVWMAMMAPTHPELELLTKWQLTEKGVCSKHFEKKFLDPSGNGRLPLGYPTLITAEEIDTGIPSQQRNFSFRTKNLGWAEDHSYANKKARFHLKDHCIYMGDNQEHIVSKQKLKDKCVDNQQLPVQKRKQKFKCQNPKDKCDDNQELPLSTQSPKDKCDDSQELIVSREIPKDRYDNIQELPVRRQNQKDNCDIIQKLPIRSQNPKGKYDKIQELPVRSQNSIDKHDNIQKLPVRSQNQKDKFDDNQVLDDCLSDESVEEPTCIPECIEIECLRKLNENFITSLPKDRVRVIDRIETWFLAKNIAEGVKAYGLEEIFGYPEIYPEIANHPYLLQMLIKPKDESGGIFREDVFQSKMKPIIVKLFNSNEARVRLKLLDRFSDYVHTFTEEELKIHLLPEILKGMQDMDKTIVRATLLCLAHLVEILGPQVVIGGTRQEMFVFHEVGPREEIDESAEKNIDSNDDSANETDCDVDAENRVKKTRKKRVLKQTDISKIETEKKIPITKHRRKNSTDSDDSEVNDSKTERKLPRRGYKEKRTQETEDDDDSDSANESDNDDDSDNKIDDYETGGSESESYEKLHSGKRKNKR